MKTPSSFLPEGMTAPKDSLVYLQNEGYLRLRYKDPDTGTLRFQMLHRYIWEQTYGPIPKGYVIHHVDGDPLNNALENLILMTRSGHSTFHRLHPNLGSPIFSDYWAKNGDRLKSQGKKRRDRKKGTRDGPQEPAA